MNARKTLRRFRTLLLLTPLMAGCREDPQSEGVKQYLADVALGTNRPPLSLASDAVFRFLHSKGVATNMTCTRMVCSPTENGWMFEFFEVPQSSGSTVIAVDRALNCTGGWVP